MSSESPFVLLLVSLVSIGASSGFWAYIIKKMDKRSAQTRLLLGISHMLIVQAGTRYKERGWITNDEYEEFHKYLYSPYAENGGNGLAAKIMSEVQDLTMVATHTHGNKQSVSVEVKEKSDDNRTNRKQASSQ